MKQLIKWKQVQERENEFWGLYVLYIYNKKDQILEPYT